MKADQERVKNLLTDTVSLLCKNGLTFKEELKVQALIGVSVDSEVFIVTLDKRYGNSEEAPSSEETPEKNTEKTSPRQRSKNYQQPAANDVVVDLTEPTPVRNGPVTTPRRRNRFQTNQQYKTPSPSSRQNAGFSPRTPNVNSPAGNSYGRSPFQTSASRQRFLSPQQSPSQRRINTTRRMTPLDSLARRNLAASMNTHQNNATRNNTTSQSPRQLVPPSSSDVVIVLDEPAETPAAVISAEPENPGDSRVVGTITTSLDSEPITIEPSIDQENNQQNNESQLEKSTEAQEEANTEPATVIENDTPESVVRIQDSSTEERAQVVSTENGVDTSAEAAENDEQPTNKNEQSEKTQADHKKVSETADPKSIGQETRLDSQKQSDDKDKENQSTSGQEDAQPDAQSDISSSEANTSVENLIIASVVSSKTEALDQSETPNTNNNESTEPTLPSLSVQNIQGNFSDFEKLDGFRIPKKPPPDDVNPEEPPKKKRALSSEDKPGNEAKEKVIKTEKEENVKVQPNKELGSKNLTTWRMRETLESQIVTPVLKKQEAVVTAFKIYWKGDTDHINEVWKHITKKRMDCDDEVAKELGISFFLSTITQEHFPAASYPALGYWIVTRHPAFSRDALIKKIQSRSNGADVKMMLKCDGANMDEYGALCQLVKDFGDTDITKRLKESAELCFSNPQPSNSNMVRIVLKENFFEHLLKNAVKNLRTVAFIASLEKVV